MDISMQQGVQRVGHRGGSDESVVGTKEGDVERPAPESN